MFTTIRGNPHRKANLHLSQFWAVALFLTVMLLSHACARRGLTTAEAKSLIQGSSIMQQSTTTLFLYENKLFGERDLLSEHPEVMAFLKSNLVRIQPSCVILGKQIGAKLVLTPSGEQAAAGWYKLGPDFWQVPTGYKQLSNIKIVTSGDSDAAVIEYSWNWIPAEIGRAQGLYEHESHATVSCRRSDNGTWHLDQNSNHELSGSQIN